MHRNNRKVQFDHGAKALVEAAHVSHVCELHKSCDACRRHDTACAEIVCEHGMKTYLRELAPDSGDGMNT